MQYGFLLCLIGSVIICGWYFFYSKRIRDTAPSAFERATDPALTLRDLTRTPYPDVLKGQSVDDNLMYKNNFNKDMHSGASIRLKFKAFENWSHHKNQTNSTLRKKKLSMIDDDEHDADKATSTDEETIGNAERITNGTEKYIVYTCDQSLKCSGFADRQRAIVGLYLLSLATNRTFCLIHTRPANLQDFYRPNTVNWDVGMEDFKGMTNVELKCSKRANRCMLNEIVNADSVNVVFVKSHMNYIKDIIRSKYSHRLPSWAQGSLPVVFGRAWVHLMKPTDALRQEVNKILKTLARHIRMDAKVLPKLSSVVCRKACKKASKLNTTYRSVVDECRNTLPTNDNKTVFNREESSAYLRHLCPIKFDSHMFVALPSNDVIDAAKGFDRISMSLVCVQIRLGRSSTISNEPVFNRISDLGAVWNLLGKYIKAGHHIFLATDAYEVRNLAKSMYGPRIHMNSDPIVHISKATEDQDAWSGMKFALAEQLLLATSCQVLIFTSTGFGSKAAYVRHVLMGHMPGVETYMLYKGRVKQVRLDLMNYKTAL